MHFQPVPDETTLRAAMPAGRAALLAKSFSPPMAPSPSDKSLPTLSPTASAGAGLDEELGSLGLRDDDDGADGDGEAEGAYFGAGQYF